MYMYESEYVTILGSDIYMAKCIDGHYIFATDVTIK